MTAILICDAESHLLYAHLISRRSINATLVSYREEELVKAITINAIEIPVLKDVSFIPIEPVEVTEYYLNILLAPGPGKRLTIKGARGPPGSSNIF